MTIVAGNITMYDIRTTFKGVAGQNLTAGWSVHIKIADGLVWPSITGENTVCHGWVLTSVLAGETVTVVTTCRMKTDQLERPGYQASVGAPATGSAPSTIVGFSTVGVEVGFGVASRGGITGTNELLLFIPTPTTEI